MKGSLTRSGNWYIELVKVMYCKQPTDGKQQPAFPHEVALRFELASQRCGWGECATMAPL